MCLPIINYPSYNLLVTSIVRTKHQTVPFIPFGKGDLLVFILRLLLKSISSKVFCNSEIFKLLSLERSLSSLILHSFPYESCYHFCGACKWQVETHVVKGVVWSGWCSIANCYLICSYRSLFQYICETQRGRVTSLKCKLAAKTFQLSTNLLIELMSTEIWCTDLVY